jgi:hypothetical protein
VTGAKLARVRTHPINPWKPKRKQPGTLDRVRYARPNRIERMMGFATQFRRVATRKHKTVESFVSFVSFVQLAAIHRWMRFAHTARWVAICRTGRPAKYALMRWLCGRCGCNLRKWGRWIFVCCAVCWRWAPSTSSGGLRRIRRHDGFCPPQGRTGVGRALPLVVL